MFRILMLVALSYLLGSVFCGMFDGPASRSQPPPEPTWSPKLAGVE